jgi:hypothetical protein
MTFTDIATSSTALQQRSHKLSRKLNRALPSQTQGNYHVARLFQAEYGIQTTRGIYMPLASSAAVNLNSGIYIPIW